MIFEKWRIKDKKTETMKVYEDVYFEGIFGGFPKEYLEERENMFTIR